MKEKNSPVRHRRAHITSKKEPMALSKIIPKLFWGEIRLPMVLFAEEDGIKIMGSRHDVILVLNLIGKQKDFYSRKIDEHDRFLERWHVAVLLERYHPIFAFLFGL